MIGRRAADGRVMRALIRPLALAWAISALAFGVMPATAAAQVGGAARCAAQVTVPAADRIGPVSLPARKYKLLVLDTNRMSCTRAAGDFRKLLKAPGNTAPAPWAVGR
jgi:hypothetical protein